MEQPRDDLRTGVRIEVRYRAIFSGDRIDGEGLVTDLSTDGARLTSARPIAAGTAVWLHVCLLVANPALLTYQHVAIEIESAVVRWSNGQDTGLRFAQISKRNQDLLHRLLRDKEEGVLSGPLDAPTSSLA